MLQSNAAHVGRSSSKAAAAIMHPAVTLSTTNHAGATTCHTQHPNSYYFIKSKSEQTRSSSSCLYAKIWQVLLDVGTRALSVGLLCPHHLHTLPFAAFATVNRNRTGCVLPFEGSRLLKGLVRGGVSDGLTGGTVPLVLLQYTLSRQELTIRFLCHSLQVSLNCLKPWVLATTSQPSGQCTMRSALVQTTSTASTTSTWMAASGWATGG